MVDTGWTFNDKINLSPVASIGENPSRSNRLFFIIIIIIIIAETQGKGMEKLIYVHVLKMGKYSKKDLYGSFTMMQQTTGM